MDGGGVSHNPLASVHKEFVTQENVNDLFAKYSVPREFDLLSIDIDGNDYWVWQALTYRPLVVVNEHNAAVPYDSRGLAIPYDPHFQWNGTEFLGAGLVRPGRIGSQQGL